MIVNKEQVLSYLPHRSPFIFIDSVEILHPKIQNNEWGTLVGKEVEGTEVVANYRVDRKHPIFKGHFPGNPILPGVIQIEMVAQAAGFAMFCCFEDPYNTDLNIALLGVQNTKFRKPIIPNIDVIIKTKAIRVRGTTFANHKGEIYNHKNELFSEMEILVSTQVNKS